MTDHTESPLVKEQARRFVSIWLVTCIFAVLLMVLIGGLTRLTESGLSIVEWQPVSGTLPPLTHEAWEESFAAYQQSPQYQQVNKGMSLEAYQGIFWLEYIHRLAGRMVGFIFLLPLVYFVMRGWLHKAFKWRLVGIFTLGGVQGVVGWYMVKSGLMDVPRVSPYRLAFHLGMAFAVLGLLIWMWRDLHQRATLRWGATAAMAGLIFLQVLLGALVAGLDAGLVYNSYPTMDGAWVPNGLYAIDPWWRNHFENIEMVQFQHRIMAHLLAVLIPVYVWWLTKNTIWGRNHTLAKGFFALFALQFLLGVLTILHQVPMVLASMHQMVAAFLFGLVVWMWHNEGLDDDQGTES